MDFQLKMQSTSGKKIFSVRNRSRKNQVIYDTILGKLIDNPKDIHRYRYLPTLGKVGTVQSGSLPFHEYVIITSNTLKNSFTNFILWKKRKGLDIGVVTTQEIYNNYSGDDISGIYDDAGKIRQYLSDAYQNGAVWGALGRGSYYCADKIWLGVS